MLGIVLNVLLQEKDRAKVLGVCWDLLQKKWGIPENIVLEDFAEWFDILTNNISIINRHHYIDPRRSQAGPR
jgi:hypothetical protein